MIIEFLTSRFSYLIDGAIGIVAFVMIIRYANWTIGIRWTKDVWPRIKDDPKAVSDYFRTRVLAIALLMAGIAIAGAIQ